MFDTIEYGILNVNEDDDTQCACRFQAMRPIRAPQAINSCASG